VIVGVGVVCRNDIAVAGVVDAAVVPGDILEIGGNDRRLATRQCDGLEDGSLDVNHSITRNFYEDLITNAGAFAIGRDSPNRACPHSAS
jgi:hypothetical protein